MEETVTGISTDCSFLHPWKAISPIIVIVDGITIDVIELPLKAPPSIFTGLNTFVLNTTLEDYNVISISFVATSQ